MNHEIRNYINEKFVGDAICFRNLQCFPLITKTDGTCNYMMLDEALAENALKIEEIDSTGSVPELKVTVLGNKKVLILDGEELVGAKQNRIVNTTILVKEQSTCTIPVSCVEQGRWAYNSDKFYSKARSMPGSIRAKKAAQVNRSVKDNGRFTADQSEIWDDISDFSARMNVSSPSMEMGAIFENSENEIKKFSDKIQPVSNQVGMIFSINGRVVGLDSFNSPDAYQKVHRKLIESYALDAVDTSSDVDHPECSVENASQFLSSINDSSFDTNRAVSLGVDVRMESLSMTGFALVFRDDVIHLSAFARSDQQQPRGRMHSFSRRRSNRG